MVYLYFFHKNIFFFFIISIWLIMVQMHIQGVPRNILHNFSSTCDNLTKKNVLNKSWSVFDWLYSATKKKISKKIFFSIIVKVTIVLFNGTLYFWFDSICSSYLDEFNDLVYFRTILAAKKRKFQQKMTPIRVKWLSFFVEIFVSLPSRSSEGHGVLGRWIRLDTSYHITKSKI